jgi:hypothetical protein
MTERSDRHAECLSAGRAGEQSEPEPIQACPVQGRAQDEGLTGWESEASPDRQNRCPGPEGAGCARSAGPCFRGLVPRGPALRAHPPSAGSGAVPIFCG